MNQQIIDGIFRSLGNHGVRKLVISLTNNHHNREVAKDFDLSLWQVRVCNQFLPSLCGELLKRENKASNSQGIILNFRSKQVA